MKEIEVKIMDIDLEEVRKKLLDLGAEKVFDGEVHAIGFDHPDMRLDKKDSFIRVRTVGKTTELCFKGPNRGSVFKSREEIEVNTNNFADTLEILERGGLIRIHESKKNRESYTIGKVRFEIDNWKDIPHFLEIEAPTAEEVKEYVEKLDFTMEQTNNWSYVDIEKHYETK
ncbi:class IV adenylate cyclase [Candidatus Woesearchaeota archaeon]|jgi:adenylate cyclase, class 2|nr:class IV adenylate cyclase [Candidatus Woesearchaeota archaeon]